MCRQASTIVRAHGTALAEHHPWDEFDISERCCYRLLNRFASKALDGRYEVGDQVTGAIRAYLAARGRRTSELALLEVRGFTKASARKWLQRHPIDQIRTAQPRGSGKTESL